MNRKVVALILGISMIAFVFPTLCSAAPPNPIIWNFATSSGPSVNTLIFTPYPRFQKMVEKATGGRLILRTKVDMFPPNQIIHSVIGGRADIGMQRIPYVSGTFPVLDVGSLPFLFENFYEYEDTINDPEYLNIINKIYDEVGLVRLADPIGPSVDAIFANKAIKVIDDFKGVKVRTTGMIPTLTLKLLGASPLTMAVQEISQAVSRGTVDAVQTGAGFGLGLGMAEVTTHVSYWPIQSLLPSCLVVNKAKWQALPQDLKKILLDVSREMQGQAFFGCTVENTQTRIAIGKILKVTVPEKSEIDKARIMVKPVVKEWLKVAGPHGPEILAVVKKYASGAKIMLGE